MMNQTILITGASSGIGAALAEAYAASGSTLYLIARNEKRLAEVATHCRARGAVVHEVMCDVRDAVAMAAHLNRIDSQTPIDLVIANAGISGGTSGKGESEEQARAIFDTNLYGVLNSLHPLMPRMIARGKGHIAIIASLASIVALPSAPAYSASKAAVRYYGESLRGVLKRHGITVSIVSPGYIDTPMTRVNKFYMPLFMSLPAAATRIKAALDKKSVHIFFPRRLYALLCLLRAMPYAVQDFVADRFPSK